MEDTAIDFVKLRKLEKLKARKRRIAMKQQKEVLKDNMTTSNAIEEHDEEVSLVDDMYIHISKELRQLSMDKQNISMDKQNIFNGEDRETEKKNKSNRAINNTEEQNAKQCRCRCPSMMFLTKSHDCITEHEISTSKLTHVYYISQCLSEEYMHSISSWLSTLPQTTCTSTPIDNERNHFGKWTSLKHAQRNVALFDLRQDDDDDSNNESHLLQNICQYLIDIRAFPKSHPPNHVLINEYHPTGGIMPHTDGPNYYNRTATISIGGDVLFKFSKRQQYGNSIDKGQTINHDDDDDDDNQNPNLVMEVKLNGKGSLIVFTDDAYLQHCHSIDDRVDTLCNQDVVEYASDKCVNLKKGEEVKRDHRISLTFRHKY